MITQAKTFREMLALGRQDERLFRAIMDAYGRMAASYREEWGKTPAADGYWRSITVVPTETGAIVVHNGMELRFHRLPGAFGLPGSYSCIHNPYTADYLRQG